MNINQYRIRLMNLRKKLNQLLDTELGFLDDDELMKSRENIDNGKVIKAEEEVVDSGVILNSKEKG